MKTLALLFSLISTSALAQAAGAPSPWDWKPWEGQVAGICGAGRPCTVSRVRTGAGTVLLPAFTGPDATTGVWWPVASQIQVSVGGARSFTFSSTLGILEGDGSTVKLRLTTADGARLEYGTMVAAQGSLSFATTGAGNFVTSITGFEAPMAFASFPAAAAGNRGRLLYDSTNSVWRISDGSSSWRTLGEQKDNVVCYFPGIALLLNVATCQWNGTSASGVVPARVDAQSGATTLVVGVGAGNAVFTIYNLTDAANTSATITVPCVGSLGLVTSGSSDATLRINKNYQWRLTSNGCTTLPVVNLTANTTYSFN